MTLKELIKKAKYGPHWYSEEQIELLISSFEFKDEIDKQLSFDIAGVTNMEELYEHEAENLLIQDFLPDELERRFKSGFLSEAEMEELSGSI